jgi:hypothetical protein
MRRWLLLVMVLLLPLRGWVGEAMASEMLQQHVAAVAQQVAPAHEHGAYQGHDHRHGHDCDEHAHAAPADADPAQPQASADCPTCAGCQACSSPALSPAVPVTAAGGFSQPRPHTVQLAYTSAEPAVALKPPRN